MAMGAHADPRVAAIFKSADLAGSLTYKMFTDGGSPGTWGNVQRRYKEHVKHEPPPATPAGAAGRTSSGKRAGAKEAGGSGCAGGSSAAKTPAASSGRTGMLVAHKTIAVQNVIGWGRSAESHMYRVALFGVVQLHASVRIMFTTPLEYVPAIYVLLTLPL